MEKLHQWLEDGRLRVSRRVLDGGEHIFTMLFSALNTMWKLIAFIKSICISFGVCARALVAAILSGVAGLVEFIGLRSL